MKFVISYSGGKDSTLALHRMIAAGHQAVGLLVMCNAEDDRSWAHGINNELINEISLSLNIPLLKFHSQRDDYHIVFEKALIRAKEIGAETCVFGDIDLEDHRKWCTERCENTGINNMFPLWQENREKLTREFILLGYEAIIKCVRNRILSASFLGKQLNLSLLEDFKKEKIDVCGENGEYHTLVINGPLFKKKVGIEINGTVDLSDISALDISLM